MFKTILLSAAASVLAVPVPAAAAPAPQAVQLVGKAEVERRVVVGGREQVKLSAPDNVVPGDRLVFETNYRNTGPAAATQFVVTNPVPAAVAWTGESNTPPAVSVDGGKTYGPLAQARVKGPDAKPRAATPADVTHLRWTLAAIAPGAAGSVKYRAVVR